MKDSEKEGYSDYARAKSSEMQNWEKDYRIRILKILRDKNIPLRLEAIPEIINATSFKVLSSEAEYKSHCPYFKEDSSKSCHPEIKDLNCFLCSCPNYDSGFIKISEKSNERILIGRCNAGSSRAEYHLSPLFKGIGFWDCSNCSVYHDPRSVENYLREHMTELQAQAKELGTKSSSEIQ